MTSKQLRKIILFNCSIGVIIDLQTALCLTHKHQPTWVILIG